MVTFVMGPERLIGFHPEEEINKVAGAFWWSSKFQDTLEGKKEDITEVTPERSLGPHCFGP